jgi:hypothetical protein
MTYPVAPLGVRIRAAIGIFSPTSDPSTWPWTDITLDVDHLVPIEDGIGSPDDDSEPSTTLSFSLKNDLSRIATTVAGRYTCDNPESDLYPFFDVGCPIEYALDVGDGGGYDIQVIAFLQASENAWPSNTQYRSVAQITCVGALQRGGVLNQVQRSPMYRTIMDRRNLAFWPLEDARGSTVAASAIPGQPPLSAYGALALPEFGSEALVPGVASGVKFSTGQALGMGSFVRPSSTNGVRLGFLMFAGTNPAAQNVLATMSNTAGWLFLIEIGPSNLRFRAYNASGVEVSGAGLGGFTSHLAGPVFVELDLVQTAPGTLQWTIRETVWQISPTGAASPSAGSTTGSFSGTLGNIANAGLGIFGDLNDVWVSALTVTEQPFPGVGGFAAVLGWTGNTAAGRVQGMCSEAGLPSVVTSTAYGAVMGPQLIDTLRANMVDVQHADHGVLSDHLGKVSYRALQELYNLAPAITLTRAVRGQLGELAPVRDDTAKANRVTATRTGGGSATVEDSYDIVNKGLYESEPSALNVAIDSALIPHAGWYLTRGVSIGYRYSELTLNMRVAGEYTPALTGQVASLQLGDRIAISSLPPQAAKGGIERQVRGRKQTVLNRGMKRWDVTYSMVPTEAYQAFILDTDRLDTEGTEVILAATTTGTVLMAATAGALPAVGSGLSIALDAAGEQVTLTAVASEVVTDTFTRTVSNGWGSIPATTHLPAYVWSPTVLASDYAATGSAGTMLLSAAASSRQQHLTGLVGTNLDHTAYATVPVLATGGGIELQVYYRYTLASGNGYTWRITIDTAGATSLFCDAPDGGGRIVDIPLSLVHTAGATYGIRCAPINGLHRFKVWLGGAGAEPDGWSVQVEDLSRLTAGYPIVRAGRASGNTNAALTISWDNFTVNNIQAFTATRSQGAGVVKAQALGNRIKLWRGKGLAI